MLDYRADFDSPWFLLLAALLPLLWWLSYKSLAGLGTWRRAVAIGIRSLVLLMLVLALAEIQVVRTSDKLTVIYVLDQSLSIPAERRTAMIDYVNAAILEHRRQEDKVGVVVFGREASMEVPPFDDDVQLDREVASLLNPESTNLAGAIRLAHASFPEDAAKRIVVVSDGKENLGDALETARAAAGASIGIDVQPISYAADGEVLVEKLALPPDVRNGQPFDLRVVLNNTTQPAEGESGVIGGKLTIYQKTDDDPVVLSEQHVDLPPGKKVFTVRQQIDAPHFYTYEARFVPDDPAADAMTQNNQASTFTHVRGSGQVLLIEDSENPGEHGFLVERLRRENLEVTIRPSSQLFTGLPELQQYDTVVLANVPREHFSDEQVAMLAQNTQVMGSGLVMLGGPNSFGAGGWTNTEVEEAMPLDFQIKSAKVVPKGALALLMHASELADGNHWQKVIAKEAVKALGNEDYCGLLHWNGRDEWLWGNGLIRVGGAREGMLGRIDRMVPGDMPQFDPGLIKAQQAFAKITDAAAKHMIIISDGDPSPPSPGVIRGLKALNVTISTVAVGCHGPAESAVMKNLSKATGGKYYEVKNPNTLPRIFQREARRVARPLVFERDQGFSPFVKFPHEIVSGIETQLPPITGFVQTTVKQNPLVEVAVVSPLPVGEDNATIVAAWTYGLGKSVAVTTDAGSRWASSWTSWGSYDKLFSQAIRWSMRPAGDQGKFTIATDVEEGKVRIFVTALDKEDEFLNYLDVAGAVIGPNMKSNEIRLEQTAPGRYVGSFDAQDEGSYFVMLSPGAGGSPILTGVNVPYSAEFRPRDSDEALLENMARLKPEGGQTGKVIRGPSGRADPEELVAAADTFRHDLAKATSRQDVWHLLLFLAGLVFFGDVFVRRVHVSLAWVPPLAGRLRDRLLGRQAAEAPPEYLRRLRSSKAEVTEQLEQRRAAARFEPLPDAGIEPGILEEELQPVGREVRAAEPPSSLAPQAQAEEDAYTARLLKVKKSVQKQRDREGRPSGN